MNAIRPSAVAGQFYPSDTRSLGELVDRFLAEADCADTTGRARAVIAPHAGYVYSGAVAATAYVWLARKAPASAVRRVLLMGTAHASITGMASSGMSGFATPLGVVPVDQDEVNALERANLCHRDEKAHARDHGLEVQLPFLQRSFTQPFQIIPLLVGATRPEEVAAVLDQSWDDATVVVVSSDLSHYLDAASAREIDRATAGAIERLEPTALAPGDACGRYAIAGLLKAARDRGLHATTLDLRNSGDTAGPRDRVVGYGAFGFSDPS